MITEYLFLSSQDKLVTEVIDFFMAEEANPELFKQIKEICVEYAKKSRKPNGETFINMGFLSEFDFLMYMAHTKKIENGIKTRFIEITLQQLVKYYILSPLDPVINNNQDQRYKVTGKLAKFLYERGLIKNLIYGFNYIIESYKNSVVKIEHINTHGDSSIGTGFLIAGKINGNSVIVTNEHVVQKATELKMFTFEDTEIKIKKVNEDTDRDIALIEIEPFDGKPFFLSDIVDVMKEIITIGYPSIPTTKYAYQVYHKGEVNSFVEDYWGHNLFLISAKTSSGNSGSPIIDNSGMVVGVITEELFEQDKFYEKGKLPYYAGIPTVEIMKTINKIK